MSYLVCSITEKVFVLFSIVKVIKQRLYLWIVMKLINIWRYIKFEKKASLKVYYCSMLVKCLYQFFAPKWIILVHVNYYIVLIKEKYLHLLSYMYYHFNSLALTPFSLHWNWNLFRCYSPHDEVHSKHFFKHWFRWQQRLAIVWYQGKNSTTIAHWLGVRAFLKCVWTHVFQALLEYSK